MFLGQEMELVKRERGGGGASACIVMMSHIGHNYFEQLIDLIVQHKVLYSQIILLVCFNTIYA